MEEAANWIAPVATTIAAMMTAANLGARFTGWGFVVFFVGSIAWCAVALSTGQTNLLWTNGFLALVNVIGAWRWLGRQAVYEEGAKEASEQSSESPAPTVLPVATLSGQKVKGLGGEPIGVVVDAMMRCDDATLAYVVVSEGGVGGVGERLHALHPCELRFAADGLSCDLDAAGLQARPLIAPDAWPARAPRPELVCPSKEGANLSR